MIRCERCNHICEPCDLIKSHEITSVTIDPATEYCPECGHGDFDDVEPIIEYVYRCKLECEGICELRYQIDTHTANNPPTDCPMEGDAEWELVSETEMWRVIDNA